MSLLQEELQILYEDKEILVCIKPAGVPVQSDRTGDYDLTSRLLNYLSLSGKKTSTFSNDTKLVSGRVSSQVSWKTEQNQKIPYLAVVHRLDRPVGGVMVFAKTKKAAAELSRQIREQNMTKRYYCVVTGYRGNVQDIGSWQERMDWLVTEKRTNLSRITEQGEANAKLAKLRFRILEIVEPHEEGRENEQAVLRLSKEKQEKKQAILGISEEMQEKKKSSSKNLQILTEVELLTGRHHQIRIQMTEIADGIWGDTKYNPDFIGKKGWWELALFSHELKFLHPSTKRKMQFQSEPLAEIFQNFSYIQRFRER